MSLAEASNLAQERGGFLVSSDYKNSNTKLTWQCARKHVWQATLSNVKHRNSWCKVCSYEKKKTSEKDLRLKIESLGWKIDEEVVSGTKSKIRVECINNHKSKILVESIIYLNVGCAFCRKLCIQDLQKIAQERNGRLIDTVYLNNKYKYTWECQAGHRWKASADNVKNKLSWCSMCSSKIGERICRAYSKGHEWYANPSWMFGQKSWCKRCSRGKEC